jgi:glycerol uptake facilitator-like aquaporin
MSAFSRKLLGEAIGSLLLFATVVGSGIMAERLAGGNLAVALLGNTLATGAILYVLITMLRPVSGAQFNPAVTLVMRLRGECCWKGAALVVLAQVAAGVLGVCRSCKSRPRRGPAWANGWANSWQPSAWS